MPNEESVSFGYDDALYSYQELVEQFGKELADEVWAARERTKQLSSAAESARQFELTGNTNGGEGA